jgi:hypothetical protein
MPFQVKDGVGHMILMPPTEHVQTLRDETATRQRRLCVLPVMTDESGPLETLRSARIEPR